MIATHRVQRYANVACHSLVRARCLGGAARRDNSGSAVQGNARNLRSATGQRRSFRRRSPLRNHINVNEETD
jgi:hypothetical protein